MLHVHRAVRADALVAPLAEVLSAPVEDPFAAEVLAVPTKGVERWLAQRLSHRLGAGPGEAGVCANVRFDSPGRLVGDVLRSLRGEPAGSSRDPWDPDLLTWTVLEVLDGRLHEDWAAPLRRYVGGDRSDRGDHRRGRRLALARHVAELFAGYAAGRPSLTAAWAAGEDTDGAGDAVPGDLAWQPPLWRAVADALRVPDPAVRLDAALEALRAGPDLLDLPTRLGVFGATRLPRTTLRVLAALAAHRDVHLWLVHPSPALWERVRSFGASGSVPVRRRDLPVLAHHGLLASMASDAVELQLRLQAEAPDAADLRHPGAPPPPTLLGFLQAQLAHDEPPREVPVAPGDRSVGVHACHGRTRQVEVLRDVLTGLFADDPTLQPRDVVVMCPDVEVFAPLITATFGNVETGGHHPGRDLRVQVADRSLRRTNPCLELLATLLTLADSRVGAPDVLDLLASAPVRHRFDLDADDLQLLRAWAAQAGARWGEDASRREAFGLGLVRQGTWDAALDRILLGVAMAEEEHRYIGSALPLDDVPAGEVDLAGRLAEVLERLTGVLTDLRGPAPLAAWLDALDRALTLLAAVPAGLQWQLVQAREVLEAVREEAVDAAHQDAVLHLPEVRGLLAGRLVGRPTRAGFRTGALTVCSLEPMRAVPHRVVCLLGMDDDAFPRQRVADGDDLLLRGPCLGERDPRSQDRQLFLDAVAAAEQTLVIVYSGADERTGASRPPAVPVAELLDALRAMAPDSADSVSVRHPLQPTDPRSFVPGALGRPGPFGFDPVAHRAAVAGLAPRTPAPSLLGRPLPPRRDETVALDDLVAFLEHPARWFLRTRVHLRAGAETTDVDDRLPLEADPLTRWAVGDRLLAARLAGADPERALQAEWRRGELPPRMLGAAVLRRVAAQVDPIASAVAPFLTAPPVTVDVTADLPQGIPVEGSVAGVRELDRPTVVRAVFSRLAGKHRLRAWVQLLALTVARPDRPWQAVTVGRGTGSRDLASVSLLTAPDPADAVRRLQDLLLLREHATRAPLPLPVAAAAAYASGRCGGAPEPAALEDAARAWRDAREDVDGEWELCLDTQGRFDAVLGVPSGGEAAWAARWGESTRFGVLARRVWEPLLAAEQRWTP